MLERSGYLVLDIETIPDTRLWTHPDSPSDRGEATAASRATPSKAKEKRAFPPPYAHKVIAIGCMLLDEDYRLTGMGVMPEVEDDDEKTTLRAFSQMVGNRRPALVSYNGRSFDMPVLALRSLHCGVPMPWYYEDRGLHSRYSDKDHIDLCDWLADHGASRASSLDALARLIGLPGKIGMDGSQVEGMFHAGRIKEIRDYCLSDVAQTALLFLRFRLLQGVFDSRTYRDTVEALTAALARDSRLSELTGKIDAGRLLSAA